MHARIRYVIGNGAFSNLFLSNAKILLNLSSIYLPWVSHLDKWKSKSTRTFILVAATINLLVPLHSNHRMAPYRERIEKSITNKLRHILFYVSHFETAFLGSFLVCFIEYYATLSSQLIQV